MNKLMGIVLVAGLAMVAGCEDKKSPAKGVTDAVKGAGTAAKDATKGAVDAGKDAAKGAVDATKDAAKGAADAVKDKAAEGMAAMRDKAVETFKPQIEAAKGKLDELTKKIDGLDAAKKAMASPLLDTAKKAFADLTGKFDALKTSTDGGASATAGVESSMKTFTDAMTKVTDMVK